MNKKRSTELTLFTLTVSMLTLLALHGISRMRVSLDAMADDTAKTYLLNRQAPETYQAPEIEFTDEDLETNSRE